LFLSVGVEIVPAKKFTAAKFFHFRKKPAPSRGCSALEEDFSDFTISLIEELIR
jgi:hypothetical protein